MIFFWKRYEESGFATTVSLFGSVGVTFLSICVLILIVEFLDKLFSIETGSIMAYVLFIIASIIAIVLYIVLKRLLNKLTDIIAYRWCFFLPLPRICNPCLA